MKFGTIIVLTIILSSIIAHLILQDPGYVAISIRSYLIEMSVPVFIGLYIIIVLVFFLIMKIIRVPKNLAKISSKFQISRATKQTTQGAIEIAEGNFKKGEKLLGMGASLTTTPLLNYLEAAKSANNRRCYDECEEWLRKAYKNVPEAANAILLKQTEFQLDQRQFEKALASIQKFKEENSDHSYVLTLLGKLYFETNDWESLCKLLPQLKKHQKIDDRTLEIWSLRVYYELLKTYSDSDKILNLWKKIPRKYQENINLIENYYLAMLRLKMDEKIEKDLIRRLNKNWENKLVRIYGLLKPKDPQKQLKCLENWLEKRKNDFYLLHATGQVCLRNELFGKARNYFELAIAIKITPEICLDYGNLLAKLGEIKKSNNIFQKGLNIETSK